MTVKKIMIVEDDDGIRDVMQTILEMSGYQVEVAPDSSAVKCLGVPLPDLFILDVWMRGGDGRKLCKFLKSQTITNHIPIIMVSATKELKTFAKQSKADGFLEKPFRIEDLVKKVKKFI